VDELSKMDEDFEHFLDTMGPATSRRRVPVAQVARYRGRLPDQLLAYWKEYGWCGHADGLFWTVDPQPYEPVARAWLDATPFGAEDEYHVIARSAFGDIYLLGGACGRKLHIIAPDATMMPPGRMQSDGDRGVRAFFRSRRHAACDLTDADGNDLFARALARLGPLAHDEMYGFVPALAFGGPATLDRLRKVNAVEHLLLLARLEPLQILPSLSF